MEESADLKAFGSGWTLGLLLRLAKERYKSTRFSNYSFERIKSFQLERIREMVSWAYERSPFYKTKFRAIDFNPKEIEGFSDFECLPLTTKDELLNVPPEQLIAQGCNTEHCIKSVTSGSSGQVLSVFYDRKALAKYMSAGLTSYSMGMNWKPWFRQVSIYTSPHPAGRLLDRYWLSYINTVQATPNLVDHLSRTKPHFVSCYPSVLEELRSFFEDSDLRPPSLRAIYVHSEASTQSERDELSRFFGCPVIDEYSTEELNRIATQCTYQNYHLFEDLNYIEVTNSDGKNVDHGASGYVVGTHLANYTMPLIRYCQGDQAVVRSLECPCGRRSRMLSALHGRANESFVLPSGRTLSSGYLLDMAYSLILDHPEAIREFCLVQEKIDLIRIEIRPGPEFSSGQIPGIRDRVVKFLDEPVKIEVTTPSTLTRLVSGKRHPIICKLKPDERR
jgi:phenylacetate-CoA ligase